MKDTDRRWHTVYTTDVNAKPMLGPFSGVSIVILLGALTLAMAIFHALTEQFKLGFLPSFVAAGIIPLFTTIVLLSLRDRPQNYALRWFQHQKLRLSQQPLLTEINDHEDQKKH